MTDSNKGFIKRTTSGIRIYFTIIAVFTGLSFLTKNFLVGAVELIILIVLAIHYMHNKKERQRLVTSYIENLTFHLDNAARDTMLHFPLPMLMITLSGNIIWYNKEFLKIADEDILDKQIQAVFPNFHLLKILEQKNNISINLEHDGKQYEIVGNIVHRPEKDSKKYAIVLYWIDRTKEHEIVKKYDDDRPISCELMLDNLEDLMKSTPEEAQAGLSAAIGKKINEWLGKTGGILRKYEKDKYHIMFENKNLSKIIDSKFDILDGMHEIQLGNKLPVTLSIGIGKGESIQKSDSYAKAAIDMALGRGGDQAVIKDDENFRFFGGRSEGYEKATKVKPRVVAYALRELIDSAGIVFIMGHKTPDPDSLGAAIGISKLVKNRSKKAYIVLGQTSGSYNRYIETLRQNDEFQGVFISDAEAMQLYDKNSLLVIVDTHSVDIVESPKLLDAIKDKVLIDHHRRGENFISDTALSYHEPFASSTCEMITEIIQYMEEHSTLSISEAQALYAGIAIDTKNFTVKTGVRTFEAASFLRQIGVDTTAVRRMFQSDLDEYVKRAKIVSSAKVYKQGIAISSWNEDVAQPNLIASISSDELLNIAGISASFVLCKDGEGIHISGRSLGDFNVQLVLERLGGGGHMTVAGAQITPSSMSQAITLLKESIDKTL
ncbi:MAG: DHH family phosphoesterase [Firmicutes bacterium]|nr:DHH family phosphoesterase [Bacillota bacterium]